MKKEFFDIPLEIPIVRKDKTSEGQEPIIESIDIKKGQFKNIKVLDANGRPTYEPEPGVRYHYGLVSQEVKQAIDLHTQKDFAGWILYDPSDPESGQGLRYGEFIAPLIKAVQELSARVALLEQTNQA